jgi:hypothetical protein
MFRKKLGEVNETVFLLWSSSSYHMEESASQEQWGYITHACGDTKSSPFHLAQICIELGPLLLLFNIYQVPVVNFMMNKTSTGLNTCHMLFHAIGKLKLLTLG